MLWPPCCSERVQYPLNRRKCWPNIVNRGGKAVILLEVPVAVTMLTEIAWLMLQFQFMDLSDLCVHVQVFKGKLLLSELFNITSFSGLHVF
jgi:hypothetical protein